MSREDDIQEQFLRLSDQRKALANALRQIAMQGEAFAFPSVLNTRDQARKDIARIKATLRAWGVVVEGHPDDISEVDWSEIPAVSVPLSSQSNRPPAVFDQQGWTVQTVYNVADPPSTSSQPGVETPSKRRQLWRTVSLGVLIALITLLLGPVVNYATAEPPPPWLAWMHGQWWAAFVVLAVLFLGLTTWMSIREGRSAS